MNSEVIDVIMQKTNKPVTIYDIAKKANTSPATVSRVLSHSNYPVRQVLKERIQKVAEELNYVPNMAGRQLKTNKSMTIGVIIPTISNPFYSSVVLGIEETARNKGYHVLLCNSKQSPELEVEYLQTLFQKQVQGIIISSISGKTSLLHDYIGRGLDVVAIDETFEELENALQIGFDYRRAGFMAAEFLIQQGHTNIGYISSPLDRPSRKETFQGYQDAIEEYRLRPRDHWIKISEHQKEHGTEHSYEFSNGKHLTRRLLAESDLPTAIMASNDMTATGVLNELNAQGIKVPDEISVIGFDNIELGQMITPPLTTIELPKYEMGKLACNLLFDRWDGNNELSGVTLQPTIVERLSVKRL